MRSTIRNELDDTGGTPTWSDANLNEWLNQAIRDFSLQLPQEVSTTITAVAGQSAYSLPFGLLRILRVEEPLLVIRLPASAHRLAALPNDQLVDYESSLRLAATSWTYRVFAGQLILNPAPMSSGPGSPDILLEYLASYPEPAADSDGLATPLSCDHILVHLVAASALHWILTDEEKRLAFEARAGKPSESSASYYGQLAAAEIKARVPSIRATTLEVL
jgi:hypothetical protein